MSTRRCSVRAMFARSASQNQTQLCGATAVARVRRLIVTAARSRSVSSAMDEDQMDIDAAAEHQHMEEARRHKEQDPDVKLWAGIHDEAVARHLAEAAQLKALNWALDRLFK